MRRRGAASGRANCPATNRSEEAPPRPHGSAPNKHLFRTPPTNLLTNLLPRHAAASCALHWLWPCVPTPAPPPVSPLVPLFSLTPLACTCHYLIPLNPFSCLRPLQFCLAPVPRTKSARHSMPQRRPPACVLLPSPARVSCHFCVLSCSRHHRISSERLGAPSAHTLLPLSSVDPLRASSLLLPLTALLQRILRSLCTLSPYVALRLERDHCMQHTQASPSSAAAPSSM